MEQNTLNMPDAPNASNTPNKKTGWKDLLMKYKVYIAAIVALLALAAVLALGGGEEEATAVSSGTEPSGGEVQEAKMLDVEEQEPEEKSTLEENSHASIDRLIQKYLDCWANGDLEALSTIQDVISDEEKNAIQNNSRLVDSYEGLSCYTVDGPVEDSYVVWATCDMVLSSKYVGTEDTRVPRVICVYVSPKDGEGSRFVHGNADQDPQLQAFVHEMEQTPEVLALYEDVEKRSEEVLASNEGLQTLLDSVREKQESASEEEGTEGEPSEEEEGQAAVAQNRETHVTDNVNVRSEASTESSRIALAYKGDTITEVESYDDGWSKVEYKGESGYVKTEFLEAAPEAEEPEAPAPEEGEETEEPEETEEEGSGQATAQNRETHVTDSVNVRTEASTESSRVALAYKGDAITEVESYDNGWSKVEYKGQTGYVKTEFLEQGDAPADQEQSGEAVAQNRQTRVRDTVNVRTEASTESARVALAYKGDQITQVESYDNGWSKVEYKGQAGYVKTEFLE